MIYGRLISVDHSITEDSVLEFCMNTYFDFKTSAADLIMESVGLFLEDGDESKDDSGEGEEKKSDDKSGSSSDSGSFFSKLVDGIKSIFSKFWNAIKGIFEKITGLFKKKADEAEKKKSKEAEEKEPEWYKEKCKYKNYLAVADATEVEGNPFYTYLSLMEELCEKLNKDTDNDTLNELQDKCRKIHADKLNPFAKSYENRLNKGNVDANFSREDFSKALEDYTNPDNIPEAETTYAELQNIMSEAELKKRHDAIIKEKKDLQAIKPKFESQFEELEKVTKNLAYSGKGRDNSDRRSKLKKIKDQGCATLRIISNNFAKLLGNYVQAYRLLIRLNVLMFKEISTVTAAGKAEHEQSDESTDSNNNDKK